MSLVITALAAIIVATTEQSHLFQTEDIVDQIGSLKGKHVLYCGPASFRKKLWENLRNHQLSARRFHYELFEIRTGIGLEYLFRYILDRSLKTAKTIHRAK